MREALERVKQGEEIEITQNGEVVAVWLHPEKVRRRIRTPNTVAAQKLLEDLERGRENPERGEGLSAERAEALVRALRAERDGDKSFSDDPPGV